MLRFRWDMLSRVWVGIRKERKGGDGGRGCHTKVNQRCVRIAVVSDTRSWNVMAWVTPGYASAFRSECKRLMHSKLVFRNVFSARHSTAFRQRAMEIPL